MYDKTPTNSIDEQRVRIESVVNSPFQLSSVQSFGPVFDKTPEDVHTTFDMTPRDIIQQVVRTNNDMGIDLREKETVVVDKSKNIEGARFDSSIDKHPKHHHKGRKRTFLTPEEARKQGLKYLHPSFYSQSIARTKKPCTFVMDKK